MDARNKGHWGTGDLEISLRIMGEFEDVKPPVGQGLFGAPMPSATSSPPMWSTTKMF